MKVVTESLLFRLSPREFSKHRAQRLRFGDSGRPYDVSDEYLSIGPLSLDQPKVSPKPIRHRPFRIISDPSVAIASLISLLRTR